MKLLPRSALLLFTIACCVGCDQGTKLIAQHYLRGHSSTSIVDGLAYFAYAENTGVMLGIGSRLPENLRYLLFVLLTGIVLAAVIAYVFFKPLGKITVFSISLVVGGGIGNLVDRLIRDGSVIDFMLIKIGSLESGIFNLADLEITLGMCILCFSLFRSKLKGV